MKTTSFCAACPLDESINMRESWDGTPLATKVPSCSPRSEWTLAALLDAKPTISWQSCFCVFFPGRVWEKWQKCREASACPPDVWTFTTFCWNLKWSWWCGTPPPDPHNTWITSTPLPPCAPSHIQAPHLALLAGEARDIGKGQSQILCLRFGAEWGCWNNHWVDWREALEETSIVLNAITLRYQINSNHIYSM